MLKILFGIMSCTFMFFNFLSDRTIEGTSENTSKLDKEVESLKDQLDVQTKVYHYECKSSNESFVLSQVYHYI